MENKKFENKFAMHLSGLLEGMNFEQGTSLLDGLCLGCRFYSDELVEAYGYEFRNECQISIKDIGHGDDGIIIVYFRVNVNPTYEEMIEVLEDCGEYDGEESEQEVYDSFDRLFHQECYELNYDELLSHFEDVQINWDVLINEDHHYYRGGNPEIQQY